MTTQKISMDMVYAIQAFACYRKANGLYVGFEHLRIFDFILIFMLIALDLVKGKVRFLNHIDNGSPKGVFQPSKSQKMTDP